MTGSVEEKKDEPRSRKKRKIGEAQKTRSCSKWCGTSGTSAVQGDSGGAEAL